MHEQIKKQLTEIIRNTHGNTPKDIHEIIDLIDNYSPCFEASSLSPDSSFVKILDFLPDPAFIINSEGVVVAWNPALEKMTAVSAKEVVGKGNFEHIE